MSQDEDGGKVALAEAIAGLRTQIREASRRAASLPRQERFHITDVEIELTVVAEGTVKGGTEVGWWIFKANGELSAKEAVTHKVKLKLDVGSIEVGSDLETN
jgi:hypothetical protein